MARRARVAIVDELLIFTMRDLAFAKQAENRVQHEERRSTHDPRRRAIAAPSPLARVLAQPRPHGIEHDVAANLQEVRFVDDRGRAVRTLEDMPGSVVPSIEPLRVRAVEMTHSCAARRLGSLQEEMEVIRHDAVRVAEPCEPLHSSGEHLEPGLVVMGVEEEALLGVAPRTDVKEAAWNFDSRLARHDETVRRVHAPQCVFSGDQVPGQCPEQTQPGTRSRDSDWKDTGV
jgi:hypothetical protein